MFGLYDDGGAAPAAAPAKKSWFKWPKLRPDAGVVQAGHVTAPASAPALQGPRHAGFSQGLGLVPDHGGAPAPKSPEPIYPPGARQKDAFGHTWPPYPRSRAPKAAVMTQYHHAHYWPLPYACQDRAYVRALSAAQVAAGRAEHAALHGFHFDPETHLLTDAGRDHLRTEVLAAAAAGVVSPIVVSDGGRPEIGAARLAAVQEAVGEMGAPQLASSVSLGVQPATGRPAEEIDRLRRDELGSTPQPRIPVLTIGAGPAAN
jgi:hypothetical protein